MTAGIFVGLRVWWCYGSRRAGTPPVCGVSAGGMPAYGPAGSLRALSCRITLRFGLGTSILLAEKGRIGLVRAASLDLRNVHYRPLSYTGLSESVADLPAGRKDRMLVEVEEFAFPNVRVDPNNAQIRVCHINGALPAGAGFIPCFNSVAGLKVLEFAHILASNVRPAVPVVSVMNPVCEDQIRWCSQFVLTVAQLG